MRKQAFYQRNNIEKSKLPMDDEPLHGGVAGGGGSLSARYLLQPQRLIGSSLPPLVADAGVTTSTRGYVTLAVPHILESAATTQSLPETSLVRFRWRHEASQRGSLFQPVKITNAPGLLLRRRRTTTRRDEREAADLHGEHWNKDDDDGNDEEEEETKQHGEKSHETTARSIEMVYPVCVDPKRFIEYLRDMVESARFLAHDRESMRPALNELVLDVIDRSTRRKYGKCVIPLFTSSAASNDGNSRFLQESQTALEHVLRQLRRDNALYEIKSLDSDQDDDMIVGYLAIKLDIQFREIDDEALARPVQASLPLRSMESPISSPAPVLVPRTNPIVQVNVRQNAQTRRIQHNGGRGSQFGDLSPISYLESDTFHTLQGSSPESQSMMSSMCSLLRQSDNMTYGVNGSPLQSSKLQHVIEKGKALQKSMAEAAEEEEDGWHDQHFPIVTSASAHLDDGVQEIVNAASYEGSSDNVSDHDPRSWQSILKQAQMPLEEVEPRAAHGNLMTSGSATTRLPLVNDVGGLKIGFEAVKFTSGFIDLLQQLRDSAISSRFSPIEMTVSHTDIGALLASPAESDSTNQVERTEPLFMITPSLRKRAFRLTFSHIAPIRARGSLSTLNLLLRSSKEQLHFHITCRTQGTPRRHQQGSRHDKKNQIFLCGAIPVRDILCDQETGFDLQVVNVSLFIHQEGLTTAHRTRKPEKAHRVGVMKVTFQPCSIKVENNESVIKDENHLIYSSPSSTHEWTRQTVDSPRPTHELKSKETSKRIHPSRHDASRNLAPGPMATTQLAVMIDKASSICSSEARLRRVPLGESVLRFQYAIPPSGSANRSASPIGSFKRSFRRKLIRGPEGRVRAYSANVGHVGVFPLDVDQLFARDFKKRLLLMLISDVTYVRLMQIIEVWLQGLQHAKDDEGELLGLVKIPFTGFASYFRESSSDCVHPILFVGVDEQLPIEDPFSGQVSGLLQIRIAVGTAEQIIALNSTVRAIVRLQAIVRGALTRKANIFRRRIKSSRNVAANLYQHPAPSFLSDNEGKFEQDNHSEVAEVISSGESLEAPSSPVDDEPEELAIQLNDTAIPIQEDGQDPFSTMASALFSRTRRLLPAKMTLSIQVLSVTDLMHAIEEKWSQVCASTSELELKKHLEGLLTDGVVTVILECDFCLGVEIEETTEARSMEFSGATSRLYKKGGWWYKHLQFPATQCAVMNSKQLLQMRSPLQVQVVVHPEVIQIIQDECLKIRILSWCPRSNAEYHIGSVSVPIAAVLFRPSGVQGAFSIEIGDVLSGRLEVQVQIDHQSGAPTSDQMLPVFRVEEREHERILAESTFYQPRSPTSPGEVATNHSLANRDDKPEPAQDREDDYRPSKSANVGDQGTLPSPGEEHHDVLNHHETEPIASSLDQYSDNDKDFLVARSAVSVEGDLDDSYSSWEEVSDAEGLLVGEARWSDNHFINEECNSVVAQDDVQAADIRPVALDDIADYYKPITLASLGIEEFELSPLSDRMSPSARFPDNAQLFAAHPSCAEPSTSLQQDDHQFEEVNSPVAHRFARLVTDHMEGEVGEDLTSAAVMPQQDEISRGQDADVESDRAAEEEVTCEREPDEVPESSTHQEPEFVTAGSASFFSADGEQDVPQGSCILSERPNDETRSLGSEYADHGTDDSAEEHSDVPIKLETAGLLVTLNSGESDVIAAGSIEMNGLSSSTSQCESREAPAETDAIVSEVKADQVNMESCGVTDRSNQNDVKDANRNLESGLSGVCQATNASSESAEHAEQKAPVHENPLQPKHLVDKSTTKEMVDAACGADDDFDCIPEIESSHGSGAEQNLPAKAHHAELEVKDGTLELSMPSNDTELDADGKITPPSSGDSSVCSGGAVQEPSMTQQGQEPSKESSFSLPVDKFELICQLLIEIRDSCGSGLVKEILLAHNTRVAQNSSQTEQISVEEHPTRRQDDDLTVQRYHSEAVVELDNMSHFTGVASRKEEFSMSPRFRQSSSTESATETGKSSTDAHDSSFHQFLNRTELPKSPRYSPVHAFKRDLKAVHWRDSSTLQKEMQRHLKTCDDDKNSREQTVETVTNTRTSPRYDTKLFGDDVEALAAPLFAFSTRQMKKPLPFKADSETERIARIMQGSVNYWRKGDEHALTSDDDSVDSFDSDDDDWCF